MKQIGEVILFFFLAILFAGCTEEISKGGGEEPRPGGDGSEQRREVQLTLNNELVLKKITTRVAGDPIATVEENAIASLDVYVFGSAEEEGTYTFQERFAYRADEEAGLPAGATRLDLTPTDDTKKQTKGLLKLKKGLFVKLYCIANCTTLINPETTNPVKEKDFIPLTYSASGETGTGVANEGSPHEDRFVTFHTPLLDADQADDILLTPLAMSGAYTIPLDLTDFETSARVQLNLKLTRLAARFDIVNKADESRFTINEIAMGNGRRGSAFFPIRIYGQTPAANAGELITYPVRPFDGADAGTQTGAFYSYPSPLNDNGFLILKGTYQVNQTEEKKVSYQIPFIQYAVDGSSTAIEINNNHRYTIGITEADDYHLDFTLTVADWTDNGKIDDYTPGEDDETILNIRVPESDTKSRYDGDKTVNLSLVPGSYFDVDINANAALTLMKTYVGGLEYQQYDWLDVTMDPIINTKVGNLQSYHCKISIKENYTKGQYPRCVLRFQNVLDGREVILFVQALSVPQIIGSIIQGVGNFHSVDIPTNTVSMYRTTENEVQLKVYCAEELEASSVPDWLTVSTVSSNANEVVYSLKVNDPNAAPEDNKGSFDFKSKEHGDLQTTVIVKLLSTEIMASNQNVKAANSGTTSIPITSPAGCTATVLNNEWGAGQQWFTISKNSMNSGADNMDIAQSDNTQKIMKNVTIHLENNIKGGENKNIIISPSDFTKPSLSSTNGTLENVINESTSLSFNVTPTAGSYEYTGITDGNIASVSQSGNKFTVTAKHKGTTTINFRNKSATSQTASYQITVSIDYNGKAVYKYNNVYIAPENISNGTTGTDDVKKDKLCSSVTGGWRVPGPGITSMLLGVHYDPTSGPVFQYLKNNNVFQVNNSYWLSSDGEANTYALFFRSSNVQVSGGILSSEVKAVRCMRYK